MNATRPARNRLQCPSCQLARINGIVCHETGCPDRHLFTRQECCWCGSTFRPARVGQQCCSASCRRAFRG